MHLVSRFNSSVDVVVGMRDCLDLVALDLVFLDGGALCRAPASVLGMVLRVQANLWSQKRHYFVLQRVIVNVDVWPQCAATTASGDHYSVTP